MSEDRSSVMIIKQYSKVILQAADGITEDSITKIFSYTGTEVLLTII